MFNKICHSREGGDDNFRQIINWFLIMLVLATGPLACDFRIVRRDAVQVVKKKILVGHSGQVILASFSPDNKDVLTVSSKDDTARLWDVNNGRFIRMFKEPGLTSAFFNPNGHTIGMTTGLSLAKIIDAETGDEVRKIDGKKELYSGSFSPNGNELAVVSPYGFIKIFNVSTGDLLLKIDNLGTFAGYVMFSPDGQAIVTIVRAGVGAKGDGTTLALFDAQSGQKRLSINNAAQAYVTGGGTLSPAFSPDSKKVVTQSSDNTAKVFDAENGALLLTLTGHKDDVMSARFSPDGKKIVTASKDKTAKVWNAETGALLATLRGHSDIVQSACFSPSGKEIVTASGDETAIIWYLAR